jgi:hypothetical protein
MGNDIILIQKSRENELSPFGVSWLDYCISNKRKYGNPVYRIYLGNEFLLIQTDLEIELDEWVIDKEDFFTINWEENNI